MVAEFNRLEQSLLLIFDYLKVEMIAELQRQGHRVTGKLINSIEGTIVKSTDFIRLDGTFIYYGRFVDTGRRAGAKRVPIEALEDWIKRKGFENDAKKIKGIAFAIQKTIFDKGISQPTTWKGESTKNFMTGTLNKNEKRIQDDVFDATEEALELIIFNVLKDIESKSNGTVKVT